MKQSNDGLSRNIQDKRPITPETMQLSGGLISNTSANLQMKLDDKNRGNSRGSSNDNSLEAAAGISFSLGSSTGNQVVSGLTQNKIPIQNRASPRSNSDKPFV